MRIRFRMVKDIAIVPLHAMLKLSLLMPGWAFNIITATLGMAGKAYYFVPGSHVRRTTGNLCRVIGRSDPRAVYLQLVDNVVYAARAFGWLMRSGPDAVAEMTSLDEASLAGCREAWEKAGAAIFVAPHCAGSVLSAVRFGREFPTVLLLRESKSQRRGRIMRKYLEKLGPELLFIRRADPASIARGILRGFRGRKFIVGATDMLRRQPGTIEATVFGQRVHLPDWPARFAARSKVPIVPAYIRTVGGRMEVLLGEPFFESDVSAATQRWANFFEKNIREFPADWPFMFEKRWSRVLAAAAAETQH